MVNVGDLITPNQGDYQGYSAGEMTWEVIEVLENRVVWNNGRGGRDCIGHEGFKIRFTVIPACLENK